MLVLHVWVRKQNKVTNYEGRQLLTTTLRVDMKDLEAKLERTIGPASKKQSNEPSLGRRS